MREIGRQGQKRYGGVFFEEFIPDLRGDKGIRTYNEMSNNDDVIGAALFTIKMLLRKTKWSVQPGGSNPLDREAADFVESCLYDMSDTWTDTLSNILSFLTYGWSYHEIVYKRRCGRKKKKVQSSKYNDYLIGWAKLPIRSQESLYQWEYDNEDNLLGMTQMPPPDYGTYTIPIEKAMLFRTENIKGNPEGRSILRTAYRSWYFKKRIQEIEGIGIERDLTGLPVLNTSEDSDVWGETEEAKRNLQKLDNMMSNVRRDRIDGLVMPSGYEMKLLSTNGSRPIDTNTVIERYDTRIAMSMLADFIMLGHQKVGSFALNDGKQEMFSVAIGAFLDIICETFNNQGIPALIDINGERFSGITDYPQLTHDDVEAPKLSELGAFIKDMTGVGILIPDEELENYVRNAANLPQRNYSSQEGTLYDGNSITPQENKEDMKVIEEAKKRLGRK